MAEDFWDVHFTCAIVEGRAVDFNTDSISDKLLAVLLHYLEVGDVGLGVVARNTVCVNCTGDLTIVFFTLFPNIFWIILFKKGCNLFLCRAICILCFVLLSWNFIVRVHKDNVMGVGSFEDDLYTGILKDFSQFLTKAGT